MLCALDFALAEGVNEAILDLSRQNIIGAVSCLAVSDLWPKAAQSLLGANVDQSMIWIGLSLRLTGPFSPLTPGFAPDNLLDEGHLPRWEDLARSANCFSLERTLIEAEFRAQVRRFSAHLGQTPQFVVLEPCALEFSAIAKAVTPALAAFGLNEIPVLCPVLSRQEHLRDRVLRRVVWRSRDQLKETWSRRMLLPASRVDRLPPKLSWRQDGQIWTSIVPSYPDERLSRLEENSEIRVDQAGWFLD